MTGTFVSTETKVWDSCLFFDGVLCLNTVVIWNSNLRDRLRLHKDLVLLFFLKKSTLRFLTFVLLDITAFAIYVENKKTQTP